ncbi:hypothetical protein E1N52_42510 [Paraburkholderia guartelaensis]|uniref:Novel STAND NTPase 3 domain-containing protein n=1 Tax=Paraburkholderia guartelaensis TaxID=2546446 RepID=A0A4R5L1M9_9BURK|nr:DEAD/DEAH box helicase family protein [Paraburkholderia guartelaensis]TDG01916.1 hypothetical protein E1N52_42510 [Paraburkholderia guartelaensis]
MFHLHTLGWHSFQQLCLSVSREVLGQTVQSFLDTNDGGRDGAFLGRWTDQDGELLSGRFVIQCKFTSRVGYALTPSDLEEEFGKVRRLVDKDECDIYILMTNAGVSAETDLKVKEKLREAGVESIRIFGATWLEDQIRESKHLRMMVPRVYGLGDLSQILDERAYAQARAVLESMRDELAKVVVTDSYRKAAKALDAHGFVLLIGEPASGKTTIASLLAMASADQWGASVLKLVDPKSVVDRWNPDEKSQFFWIDDAFGVTQYESGLAAGWNQVLNEVKTILQRGNRVVMTSRDYIYNRARQDLKESSFPLFRESQVVIDVHDLAEIERQQILFNHLRLGKQTRQFRTEVKPHLVTVAAHDRFIPEIARRLADPFFTKKLVLSDWSLARFVDEREQLLVDVCSELDADSKAALALIYMGNGRLLSPISLTATEEEALKRLGSNLGACSTALEALRGSLAVHVISDCDSFWTFKHPTIGDAFSAMLRSSPELLGIYVRGAEIEKMMLQVTCGDVGVEGAVVLPASLFGLVIERLTGHKKSSAYKTRWLSDWRARQDLHRFLARRCSKQFLVAYLEADERLIESIVKPMMSLEFSGEVDLAIRLFKLGFLPEEARRTLIETVSEYAKTGDDVHVLNDPELCSLLKEGELRRLREAMRTQLLPRIEEVRLQHQERCDREYDAEWEMRHFRRLLSSFEESYPSSWRIRRIVKEERLRLQEWIDQNPQERETSSSRDIAVDEPSATHEGSRSLFDDVDE